MHQRCRSKSRPEYPRYGGRGIIVVPEWTTFVGFLDWALDAGYRDDRSLDRVNNDGPYSPDNCRWVLASLNSSRGSEPTADARSGRLTVEAIADLVPVQSPRKVADGRGLYLHLTPRGAGWRFRYRIAGREKILTIGRYPDVRIDEAREFAAIARSRVSRGIDPMAIRRATNARAVRRGKIRGKKDAP